MDVETTKFNGQSPKISRQSRLARAFLSVLLALLLIGGMIEASREAFAAWLAEKHSLAGIRRAQRWDPSNPEFPAEFARTLAASSPGVNPLDVVHPLELAATLVPNRADTWASLGGAFEAAEKIPDAGAAFLRALALFPRSPEINWEYANFLIRAGKAPEALAPMRQAMIGDPTLRTGSFDLAWRAGIPSRQILQNIPDRQDILSSYLDYLVLTNRLDAAQGPWNRILESTEPIPLDAAFRYFDALLYARRIEPLTAMWRDLSRHEPEEIHSIQGSANLIMNANFADTPLNGGFDWRITPIEGAEIGYDAVTVHSGARSLAVHFDGTRNLEFGNIVQYVAVDPNTSYRFVVYARTQAITTGSGPRFAIYDAMDRKALSVESENLLGTADWREQNLEFRTGAATRLLVIQIARPQSHKLDNLLAGTLWLDDFSLTSIH